MLIKQCQFKGKDDDGIHFHLLRPGYRNAGLTKEASARGAVLAEIDQVMRKVPRDKNLLYALVSAMGAWEYYGQNTNGDAFPERSLIHTPPNWNDLPMKMRPQVGRNWEWGYPTFYNAHAFQHHVNKDPARAFGTVVHAMWDPFMKRVLLVLAFDRQKADATGAISVIDKVENGEFPDVSMGCFSTGMLVSMADGTRKPIEDVAVGDEVITHKGRPRKVTEVHRRKYKGDLYSIKAEAHRVIRCTHRHPFLSVLESEIKQKDSHSNLVWRADPALSPDWVHAECLNGEYLIEPVLRGEQDSSLDQAKLQDMRDLARITGYYLADGHLLRNDRGKLVGIELTVNKNNQVTDEIDELCDRLCTKNRPIVKPKSNSDEALLVDIRDGRLAGKMLEFAGSYSKDKRLSREVMEWPPSLLCEMLGAYMSGDGCSYNGSIRLSTASLDLAYQFMALLPRLGILASMSSVTHKAGSGFNKVDTEEHAVWIGKQWSPILAPYSSKIKTAEVLKKKRSRAIYGDRIVTPIHEIESMYVETTVYNLEVEEDESYLVEGLAVHNCKVPFDVCTRCGDWDRITGNPQVDLKNHREDPIQGLSETTKDYCDHLTNELGRIYSDGIKAGMINLHPRFFDLSVVFIGADKTSKVMAKLAGRCPIREKAAICGKCRDCDISSTHVYEVWTGGREKVASSADNEGMLKEAFAPGDDFGMSAAEEKRLNQYFSRWKNKSAEIEKQVKSNFAPMLPKMDRREDDLPEDVINEVSRNPSRGLCTAGSLGVVLKPREFQRTMLISMGRKPLADALDHRGMCFRTGAPPERVVDMGGSFIPSLIEKLIPLLAGRSAFGPAFHKRVIIMVSGDKPRMPEESVESDDHPLLHKLSAGYTDYRRQLMYKVARDASKVIEEYPQVLPQLFPEALDLSFSSGLAKTGGDVMQSLIGMMPSMYLNGAYLERPISDYVEANPGFEGIVAAGALAARGRVA